MRLLCTACFQFDEFHDEQPEACVEQCQKMLQALNENKITFSNGKTHGLDDVDMEFLHERAIEEDRRRYGKSKGC